MSAQLERGIAMHCQKPIVIYKGDDTAAFKIRKVHIVIEPKIPYRGVTAKFTLLSFNKEFTNEEVESCDLRLDFTSAVTASFPLGECFGVFRIYDEDGNVLTTSSRIPFLVVPSGSECPYLIKDGMVVADMDIVTIKVGIKVDYNSLTGKPKIDGVELHGNVSSSSLGLVSFKKVQNLTEAQKGTARTNIGAISAYCTDEGCLVLDSVPPQGE